jgi:putative transposase
MTDSEWALIEPLIPPAKRGGRKREINLREVVNAIFYVLSTGCQWRFIPKDLPPKSTAYEYFRLWEWDGTLDRIHYALYVQVRELAGKEASPTAAVIDSQSVKAAERGGASMDAIGYDAGKKVKGVKRHIVVDTLGMILAAEIQPADVQDRDGALPVLREARRLFVFVKKIFADGGYQGQATAKAVAALGQWEIEIVKRSDCAKGFVVLPKRWIVERTFGWLGRCRRLAKHFENLTRTALAFLRLAMIRLMVRRIARAAA